MNPSSQSRIAALESDIVLLKEFGSLVDQYNELMKERRFAEAEIIAKKARELMKDEPAALLMIEKAKLLRQIYFNSNANVRGDGGSIGMEAPANIPITTLKLQHAKATDVAEKFKQLDLGPVDAIVVDERTNSLMVRGTERQIKDIEQLIEVLDAEVSPTGHGQAAQATTTATGPTTDGASPLGRGGFGRSSPPAETSIAEYRRRLNGLEKPVLDLAEKVRAAGTSLGKEHPEYQKLLADMRALVQQTFAARQEIQRAELAEFTRRLQRMNQAIETREKSRTKL